MSQFGTLAIMLQELSTTQVSEITKKKRYEVGSASEIMVIRVRLGFFYIWT